MAKTAVITGSGRGLGLAMAKVFRAKGFNVVVSDFNEANLANAVKELNDMNGLFSGVTGELADVTSLSDLEYLWNKAVQTYGAVDIWINNAGVNQPMVPMWELTKEQMDIIVDIDLKGAMYGCRTAINGMNKQGYGCVYCIEGFGSNDAVQLGLTVYGASKRAVKSPSPGDRTVPWNCRKKQKRSTTSWATDRKRSPHSWWKG